MTETEYRAAIAEQRYLGLHAVQQMLNEWRRELWPDPIADPIAKEDTRRRYMQQIATETYWGVGIASPGRRTYGGICGA